MHFVQNINQCFEERPLNSAHMDDLLPYAVCQLYGFMTTNNKLDTKASSCNQKVVVISLHFAREY